MGCCGEKNSQKKFELELLTLIIEEENDCQKDQITNKNESNKELNEVNSDDEIESKEYPLYLHILNLHNLSAKLLPETPLAGA